MHQYLIYSLWIYIFLLAPPFHCISHFVLYLYMLHRQPVGCLCNIKHVIHISHMCKYQTTTYPLSPPPTPLHFRHFHFFLSNFTQTPYHCQCIRHILCECKNHITPPPGLKYKTKYMWFLYLTKLMTSTIRIKLGFFVRFIFSSIVFVYPDWSSW